MTGNSLAAFGLLRAALRELTKGKEAAIEARRKTVAKLREEMLARRAKMIDQVKNQSPIHPLYLAHCLNELKAKDAIIVNELGLPVSGLDLTTPRSYLGFSLAGGLGFGLGGGLGAKLAAPDREVIAAVGDGSYYFGNPLAYHYVGRAEKLPTLTIIANNSAWHAVRQATRDVYPEGHAATANSMPLVELNPAPDFEKVAESCGGHGREGHRSRTTDARDAAGIRSCPWWDAGAPQRDHTEPRIGALAEDHDGAARQERPRHRRRGGPGRPHPHAEARAERGAGHAPRSADGGEFGSQMHRAGSNHPATLEMYAELGLYERLEARGLKASTFQYWDRERGELIAEFDHALIKDATRFPFVLQCERLKVCEEALAAVTAHELCDLRMGTTFVSLSQGADWIEAEFTACDGSPRIDPRALSRRRRGRAQSGAQIARHRFSRASRTRTARSTSRWPTISPGMGSATAITSPIRANG